MPAGRTAILANTTTIWVVPLSLIFLREHIPAGRWLAAGLGLAGVAVLINPLAIDWSSLPVIIGHIFLLGAGLSWSIAIIVTRSTRPRQSMFALLPWCFLVGALVLAPMLWWHAPHGTLGDSPASWWALAYIGLVAGPVGTWCIMEATAKLPTMVSSVGFLTTPAISLITGQHFAARALHRRPADRVGVDHGRGRFRRLAGRKDHMILNAIQSGEGPPVVMLHGLFGAARNFGAAQRALSPAFRVIALDMRNHGDSPHATDMRYPDPGGRRA